MELLAPRAQDKGIEIAIDVADDVPVEFIGDADRIRQIVVNLAGNAIKFTNQGGVGVTIRRVGRPRHRPGGLGYGIRAFPRLASPLCSRNSSRATTAPAPAMKEPASASPSPAASSRGWVGASMRIPSSAVAAPSPYTCPFPSAPTADGGPSPVSLQGRKILIVADSPYQAPFLARRLSPVRRVGGGGGECRGRARYAVRRALRRGDRRPWRWATRTCAGSRRRRSDGACAAASSCSPPSTGASSVRRGRPASTAI